MSLRSRRLLDCARQRTGSTTAWLSSCGVTSRWYSDDAANPSPRRVAFAASKLQYSHSTSLPHTDLTTFLAHAQRTNLDRQSTYYVGTHYEYTVAASLARLGFCLERVGGVSDRGVDLVGTWALAGTSSSLRVLVQCKGGAQRVGPQHVRELEGASVGALVGWRGTGVIGLLVGERAATKGVRDALGRSRWPMAYVCCSKGFVKQMLWNRVVDEVGLEGFGVALRHEEGGREPQLVLTRNGKTVS